MFIQTEATPNPATLKFLPGRTVMEEGTFEARDPADAERSPLARALMELPGVSGVFFANDFISVTKTEGEWQHLRPAVLGVVTEFFLSGAPLIETGGADVVTTGEFFDPKDAETVEAIKELIETRVRPAVAGDGGDIIFKGFRDGVVYLKMKGACSGCPSSTATLRNGIQNLLKHFLPDVQAVESIEGDAQATCWGWPMFFRWLFVSLFLFMWVGWFALWRVMAVRVKAVAQSESVPSRLSHVVPLLFAAYLLAAPQSPYPCWTVVLSRSRSGPPRSAPR